MKLSDIAAIFGGRLERDGVFATLAFGTAQPGKPFLTFLEKEKFMQALLNNNQAVCVIAKADLAERLTAAGKGVLICDEPKALLFNIHNTWVQQGKIEYVLPEFDTMMGENCSISPLSSIDGKNVRIGNHVTIEPFVTIKGHVVIGDNCTIRAGAVIGGKGFSFAENSHGERIGVSDGGQIIIRDNCEVFELAQLSTPPFPWEKTILEQGVKIDAQAHIGHGAWIGQDTLVAEGARVCGNARVGAHSWVGVGAIVSNRVEVGTHSRVSIGAVATKNVPDHTTVSGNFAIEHQRFLQNLKKSIKEEETL